MSQENVEIAKRSIEALAAGGVEAALSFLACDVVWYPYPGWVEESEYRGHDGFRRMAALYGDNFDDYAIRIEEFRDVGDRVVELGENTGRSKAAVSPFVSRSESCFLTFATAKSARAVTS